MGKRERQRQRKLQKQRQSKAHTTARTAPRPLTKLSKKGASSSATNSTCVTYDKESKILVLGDGDFSFSRGLCSHLGQVGTNVTATSYDSQKIVLGKYPKAKVCIDSITSAGATVKHKVDATNLTRSFRACYFDRIVFNFPHTGKQRVHLNRNLVRDFFTSSANHLSPNGQVHLTIKNRPPYSLWNIPQLIEDSEAPLALSRTLKFDFSKFPGYRHKTTDPNAKVFEADHCLTYVLERTTPLVRESLPPSYSVNSQSGDEVEDVEERKDGDDKEETKEQQAKAAIKNKKKSREKRKRGQEAPDTVEPKSPQNPIRCEDGASASKVGQEAPPSSSTTTSVGKKKKKSKNKYAHLAGKKKVKVLED